MGTMLTTHVSFFNELNTEYEPCSQESDSFFNELDIERELCSQAFDSFFNELDTERELFSQQVLSQHDVQRLVCFPLTQEASDLTPV